MTPSLRRALPLLLLPLAWAACDLLEPQPPASLTGTWEADATVTFDTTFAVEGDDTYRSVSVHYEDHVSTVLMATDEEGWVTGSITDLHVYTGSVRYTRHDGVVVTQEIGDDEGPVGQFEAVYTNSVLRFETVYGPAAPYFRGLEADFSEGTGVFRRGVDRSIRLDRLGGQTLEMSWADVEARFRPWTAN